MPTEEEGSLSADDTSLEKPAGAPSLGSPLNGDPPGGSPSAPNVVSQPATPPESALGANSAQDEIDIDLTNDEFPKSSKLDKIKTDTTRWVQYGELRERPWNPERYKYTSARAVALAIVFTFAISIGFVLIVGAFALYWAKNPADAEGYSKAFGALLGSLGTFATTVFGPLLAFILGYYFGKAEGSPSPPSPPGGPSHTA